MTPDLTTRPACRTPRGLARFIAGLALVAVTAACGSSDQNDVAPAGSKPAATASPAPVTTASQEVTEASPAIQSEATPMPAGGIEGPYTLHIPRIAVDARVVSIQSNAERILE